MENEDIMDDDLFADLYGEDEPSKDTSAKAATTVKAEPQGNAPASSAAATTSGTQDNYADEDNNQNSSAQYNGVKQEQYSDDRGYDDGNDGNGEHQGYNDRGDSHEYKREEESHGGNRGGYQQESSGSTAIKEDGKMFIGGLNWETTDESLKDYFSQFGEVTECTVMRDGPTGRSRGFGFLTFKDPKTVNIVMVKEHYLDGKIIDPKRAIPRDEQEKTSKIFVGGISQEATEQDFREYFQQFGRVLDSTLMIDKDTGRPRGFGFVTFDSEAAVENALAHPNLAIHDKPIEVKKAQPRGNIRDRQQHDQDNKQDFRQNRYQNNNDMQQNPNANNGGGNFAMNPNMYGGMNPAMMAAYWQKMQQYMAAMQRGGGAGMPMMPGMAANPMMMQQFAAMAGMGMPGMGGGIGPMGPMGRGMGGPQMPQQGFNQGGFQQNPMQQQGGPQHQQQQFFEQNPQRVPPHQRQYMEQQQQQQQQQQQPQQSNWNENQGYDQTGTPPQHMQSPQSTSSQPHMPNQRQTSRGPDGPPPNAPTGPRAARGPSASYRGAGRGMAMGARGGFQRGGMGGQGVGYHPYARNG